MLVSRSNIQPLPPETFGKIDASSITYFTAIGTFLFCNVVFEFGITVVLWVRWTEKWKKRLFYSKQHHPKTIRVSVTTFNFLKFVLGKIDFVWKAVSSFVLRHLKNVKVITTDYYIFFHANECACAWHPSVCSLKSALLCLQLLMICVIQLALVVGPICAMLFFYSLSHILGQNRENCQGLTWMFCDLLRCGS